MCLAYENGVQMQQISEGMIKNIAMKRIFLRK